MIAIAHFIAISCYIAAAALAALPFARRVRAPVGSVIAVLAVGVLGIGIGTEGRWTHAAELIPVGNAAATGSPAPAVNEGQPGSLHFGVGVNSDAGIRRLKGPTRPINALEDRLQVLSAWLPSTAAPVPNRGNESPRRQLVPRRARLGVAALRVACPTRPRRS